MKVKPKKMEPYDVLISGYDPQEDLRDLYDVQIEKETRERNKKEALKKKRQEIKNSKREVDE